MEGVTEISELNGMNDSELIDEVSNGKEYVTDLRNPWDKRVEEFGNLSVDDCLEVFYTILNMYSFSGIKAIELFLLGLSRCPGINPTLRLQASVAVIEHQEQIIGSGVKERDDLRRREGLECLHLLCKELKKPTPIRVEAIMKLINYDDNEESLSYLVAFVSDLSVDEQYRLKTLVGLIKSPKKYERHLKACLSRFFDTQENSLVNRLVAVQNLGKYCSLCEEELDSLCEKILSIATDKNTPYNQRADACDILLELDVLDFKNKASDILDELGKVDGPVFSIYQNAQNVHSKKIEESMVDVLKVLSALELPESENFESTKLAVLELADDHDKPGVTKALDRIEVDGATYSDLNFTLRAILVRVWFFIVNHNCKEELKKRLVEEMQDMVGTCSTGFACRLVNVLSGFTELGIKLSWRDQIKGNLSARINKTLGDISLMMKTFPIASLKSFLEKEKFNTNVSDIEIVTEFRDRVLDDLTLGLNFTDQTKNLSFFLIRVLGGIREEMKEEFVEYISETDFDLYMRQAISSYQGIECE